MFNVAIIGADGAKDYQTFKGKCIYYLSRKAKEGITIFTIEGNDFIERFASEYRINVRQMMPDWYSYGKSALAERNKALVKACSAIISFEDGRKNTKMLKKMAEEAGLPVRSVKPTT